MPQISKTSIFDEYLQLGKGLFAVDPDSDFSGLSIHLPVNEEDAKKIRKMGKGKGRIKAEDMHVTLAFFGDVEDMSDMQVAGILFAVHEFAMFSNPLSGNIEGTGTFPKRAKTDDDEGNDLVTFAIPSIPGLAEFRSNLINSIRFMGVLDSRLRRPDRELGSKHGFVPHITVGAGDDFEFSMTEAVPTRFNSITVAVGERQQNIPLAQGGGVHEFNEVPVPEIVLGAYRRRLETLDADDWPSMQLSKIIETGHVPKSWADLTQWVWKNQTELSFDADEWGGYDWLKPVLRSEVFYVHLSTADLTEGKPIEGMAFPPDPLTDMHGRVIKFDASDTAEYVANTTELIEATRDSEGTLVGLPIDAGTHDMGDGAGWIVGVEPSMTTTPSGSPMSIILFTVKWTELGVEKITKGIRRFFSPTIDFVGKVILGGALTNWPATKDSKNRPLLRPVELSTSICYGESICEDTMPQEIIAPTGDGAAPATGSTDAVDVRTMIQEEMQPLIAAFTQAINPAQDPVGDGDPAGDGDVDISGLLGMFDLSEAQGQIAEAIRTQMLSQYDQIREAALTEAASQIAFVRREANIIDFCQSVTSGSEEQPRGLPVSQDTLKTLLLELSHDHASRVMDVLDSVVRDGLMDFGAEYGHNRRDTTGTLELPKAMHDALISGDLTIADLGNAIIGESLGDLNQYDLTQYSNGGA